MLGGLSDNDVSLINKVFEKYQFVNAVKLFGSRAKGNFKPGSDVDLVLFTESALPDTEFTSEKFIHQLALISDELEEQLPLPYFFDLILYNSIGNIKLKEHIDRVGVNFYNRDS